MTASGSATATFGPEDVPPRSRLARQLRNLIVQGDTPFRFWTIRPASRRQVAEVVAGTDLSGPLGPTNLRVVRELAGEIRALPAAPGDPASARAAVPAEVPPFYEWAVDTGRVRLRPYLRFHGKWKDGRGLAWGETPRLGVRGAFHASSRWALHGDIFAGRVEDAELFGDAIVADTDFVAFVETAYAAYDHPRIGLRFGRRSLSFGPGRRGNLLLSDEAAPIDQLSFELPLSSWRFIAVTGILSTPLQKNVALHRLEWTPRPNLTIGAAEGAIFHGSPLQPLYVLGIIPYTLVERVQASDAVPERPFDEVRNNLLWEADLWWRWAPGRAVWAQLLLDDVATETSSMPSRLGFLAGAESWHSVSSSRLGVGVEAAKVYNYTYSVAYDDSDWSHQGSSIGLPDGPDSEAVHLFGQWLSPARWDAGLELFWKRRGEGRLGRPWYGADDPRSEDNAPEQEGELTGVIETRLGLATELTFEPSAAWFVTVRWRGERVRNRHNIKDDWRPESRLDLILEAHR